LDIYAIYVWPEQNPAISFLMVNIHMVLFAQNPIELQLVGRHPHVTHAFLVTGLDPWNFSIIGVLTIEKI
jgi:hypothetical protein